MLEELGSPENPKQYHFFGLGSWNKYLGHLSEKWKSSHSSTVRFLHCLANSSRAARCLAVSRGFLCLLSGLQPSLFINLQMVFFPPTWPLLANRCESCLVEFPLLYLGLLSILLAASLRFSVFPFFSCLQTRHFLTTISLPNVQIFSDFWKFL